MLSAQAHTFSRKAKLALLFAWVGGFVDAAVVIDLSVYTSNQTGNSAMLGVRLLEGTWSNAAYVAFLIAMFLLGAMIAGALIESARRSTGRYARFVYSAALAVEAVLLICVALYVQLGGENVYVRGMLPCLAMGLQNAAITRISGAVVRTTHVTGIVTDVGLETVSLLYWLRDRARARRSLRRDVSGGGLDVTAIVRAAAIHPTIQRPLLLAGIWLTFVLGAALGVWAWQHMHIQALLIPATFLGVLIIVQALRPVATIDRAGDIGEAGTFGTADINPRLLPREVGIYRVAFGQGRRITRVAAPDLTVLPLRMAPHERIAILLIRSDVELDDNARSGLGHALTLLRREGRDLVVCIPHPQRYQAFASTSVASMLGLTNLHQDPAAAVARALQLLPTLTAHPVEPATVV